MKTSEFIQRARSFIENKENWTKHTNARTKDGKETLSFYENAYSFCSFGALYRARTDAHQLINQYYNSLCCFDEVLANKKIVKWNDDIQTTHEEVLRAFDEAIKVAKRRFS